MHGTTTVGVSFLICLCLQIVSANAAEIRWNEGSAAGTSSVITVTGVIDPDDAKTFRAIGAASENAIVVLNSEGGSVVAAIEIGRAIRLKGFATAVASDTLCASACAFIWLAGSPRFSSAKSSIGFHAAYRVADGKPTESGVANALVGAYLNQIGLSQAAVVYVTSAPPEGMEWLTLEKARELDIAYLSLDEEVGSGPMQVEIIASPYDPLGTVAAFYGALAQANGEAAAALVIPEKRGIGPFNERSIQSFFGSLLRPLRLTSVILQSEDKVTAGYRYTRPGGEVCDGKALIETVYRYGKTLISKIRALNNC